MYKFIFLLVCMSSFLMGCYNTFSEEMFLSHSLTMHSVMKNDGPPDYKQGIYDGCASALWSRGSSYTRYNLRFRQDPEMVLNDVYEFSWKQGYRYCFISAIFDQNNQLGAKVTGNISRDRWYTPEGPGSGMNTFEGYTMGDKFWYINADTNNMFVGKNTNDISASVLGGCSYQNFNGICN
jgi:hypothetical protein